MVDTKSSIEQAKQELARIKDELRVKLDLAKKDAQTAWKEELEPRIAQIEKKLDQAASAGGDLAEKARLEATLGLQEVKASWPGLEKAIQGVVDDVKKGATEVAGEIDTAKLKGHLASMDAAVKSGEVKNDLKKAGEKIANDLDTAAKEITETMSSFAKKLFG